MVRNKINIMTGAFKKINKKEEISVLTMIYVLEEAYDGFMNEDELLILAKRFVSGLEKEISEK